MSKTLQPIHFLLRNTSSINILGTPINILTDDKGQPFVGMKSVIVGMGLDWKNQHEKMMNSLVFNPVLATFKSTADDKMREMVALPLMEVHGFLMTINPERVPEDKVLEVVHEGEIIKESVRERVVYYQIECVKALADYWLKGLAVNSREVSSDISSLFRDERSVSRPLLVQAVKNLVAYGNEIDTPVDEDKVYQYVICALYERLGLGEPLAEDEALSGTDAVYMAFMEKSVATIINLIIQDGHEPNDLPKFIDEQLELHLNMVGENFFTIAAGPDALAK